MANASLAARYRPQTFAQVVGQDMVKSILSRAAQEDRVAPAYLLSGTRGVGKTTIARIFAKALNCSHAPTGEPCNECEACRRITQGGFVDVVEIDGASNRGIDDVRRLREAVGYAPLEGRYKVFIIDEAHMLTKEAFNALLKTLEEPPARVTFVLATTEQHKFPVTIVSRCQHFVFRQIPESTLEAHIVSVLQREARPFEPEAARLIARRAAGSVRDSMSLLGQALALGGEDGSAPLTAAQTRAVLGLAGQEVMERLLDALAGRDALGVSALVRELLFQGADMGFFLRELGTLWRNLFLLRQAGPGADVTAALDLPEREITRLRELAARFSLTFIHAAWQMTLDGQRRILTSLEPAAGLELLLLNLALLPRLLPLGELDAGRLGTGNTGDGSGLIPGGSVGQLPASAAVSSAQSSSAPVSGSPLAMESSARPENEPVAHPVAASSAHALTDAHAASAASTAESREFPGVSAGASEGASVPFGVASPSTALKADERAGGQNSVSAAPSTSFMPPASVRSRVSAGGRAFESPTSSGNRAFASPTPSGDRVPPFDIPPCDRDDGDSFESESTADGVPSYLDEVPSPAAPNSFSTGAVSAGPTTSASTPAVSSDRAFSPVSGQASGQTSGLTWESFLDFCQDQDSVPLPMLRQFDGLVEGDELRLRAHSLVMLNQMQRPAMIKALEQLSAAWAGRTLRPIFIAPERERLTQAELRTEMLEHPVVKALQDLYGGTLLRCTTITENR